MNGAFSRKTFTADLVLSTCFKRTGSLTLQGYQILQGDRVLHRRNNSAERPFADFGPVQLRPYESIHPVTQRGGAFVKQAVFLTMIHRGPHALRKLHSTDETTMWRDPGGS